MSVLLPPRFNLSTHFSYVETPDRRYMTLSYQDDGQPYVKARAMMEVICDWTISDWALDSGLDTTEPIQWEEAMQMMKDSLSDPIKFDQFKYQAFIGVFEYLPWVYNEADEEIGEQAIDDAVEGLTLEMVLSTPASYIENTEPKRPIPHNATQFPIDFELCKESFFKG